MRGPELGRDEEIMSHWYLPVARRSWRHIYNFLAFPFFLLFLFCSREYGLTTGWERWLRLPFVYFTGTLPKEERQLTEPQQ
jgi:hypothetical protein